MQTQKGFDGEILVGEVQMKISFTLQEEILAEKLIWWISRVVG